MCVYVHVYVHVYMFPCIHPGAYFCVVEVDGTSTD